jgi:circadian clock protein KaiB
MHRGRCFPYIAIADVSRAGAAVGRKHALAPTFLSKTAAASCSRERSADRFCDPRRGALTTYILKLYITGTSTRAERAIANLQHICEQELRGQYQLEIIDVLEHPQRAEDDKILATPTLIKQLPPPLRRVIGDLSDKEKVLFGLEVQTDSSQSTRHPS